MEKLTRRQFLGVASKEASAAILTPFLPDKPVTHWPEQDLEIYGAEFVGTDVQKYDVAGQEIIKETRLWQLPHLSGSNESVPFLLVSRDSQPMDSEHIRSTHQPYQFLLLVPRSEIGVPLAGESQFVHNFGLLQIGLDPNLSRAIETSHAKIGSSDIPTIPIYQKPVTNEFGILAHTDQFISYEIPLIENYPTLVRNETGWASTIAPALIYHASESLNGTNFVPLPNEVIQNGPTNPKFQVLDLGPLHIVHGATKTPFTVISLPDSFGPWTSHSLISPFSRNIHLVENKYSAHQNAELTFPESESLLLLNLIDLLKLTPPLPLPQPEQISQSEKTQDRFGFPKIWAILQARVSSENFRSITWPNYPNEIPIHNPAFSAAISPELKLNLDIKLREVGVKINTQLGRAFPTT
jgi:hypothetical protein